MKRPLQHPQYPLFVVSGVALIAATYGLARLGFGLFLPSFSTAFALTPTTGGVLASGTSVLYCGAAGLGLRYAAMHPRAVTWLAGLTATVGSLGIAAAPSATVFAVAVLLAGTGAGFASPALVDLVRHNAPASRERRAQAIVNSGTGFGVVLAGVLSLVLGDAWRVAWILIAVIAAAATAGVLHGDRSGDRRPPSTSAAGPDVRGLARPLIGALVLGGGTSAVWVYGRIVLEDTGGLSPAASAGAWIALGVGGGSAVLLAPWLAGRPIALTWPLTCLGTAGATMLIGVTPGLLLPAFAGSLLFGLAYTAATSVLILWTSARGADGAAGTSALFIALVLGQAAGSFVTGALLESIPPGVAFATAAVVCAAAAISAAGVRTPMTAGPAPRRGSP